MRGVLEPVEFDEGGALSISSASSIAMPELDGSSSPEDDDCDSWPVMRWQNGTVNQTVVPFPLTLSIPIFPPVNN